MDLGSPAALISSIILGLIGTAMLIYGKKQQQFVPVIGGLALCVVPYFLASVLLMWLGGAACIAGVWYSSRFE
jgi:hypothetical protein